VNYTDLNMACPKYPYPLPNIDCLIDSASGFKTLSFMDAYSGYNQIKMDPMDAPKTAFMTNNKNYHYEVMSFGLRNASATFQRSMDTRFLSCAGDKVFAFFASIKKKEKFEWTSECEEAFTNVKELLSSPPILHRPSPGATLYLYLSVSDNAMSSVLTEDSE